ncbi:hypothetical protein ACUY2A_03955 [Corynebacterium pilbarense]
MTFLQLTTQTARAARSCIRSFSTLPTAQLSPSRSASALASLQDAELLLIDDLTSLLDTHLHDVAAFASKVEQTDARFGKELTP